MSFYTSNGLSKLQSLINWTLAKKSIQDHQSLSRNLFRADKLLNDQLRKFLDPYKITYKQWDILNILYNHQEEIPPTILDVSQKMVDHSDTSRIIDRMHKKELIEKIPCSMDKRATRIILQDPGRKLVEQINSNIDQLSSSFNKLTPQEAKMLNGLLLKLLS